MAGVEDRIRAILGVGSNDPIPQSNEENLRKYHGYLTTNLSLPFQAFYVQETGAMEPKECSIEVARLLDPDIDDGDEGLLCEVIEDGELGELPLWEIEAIGSDKNKQLIEDYAFWFGNDADGLPASMALELLRGELGNLPLDKLPPLYANYSNSFPRTSTAFRRVFHRKWHRSCRVGSQRPRSE